MFTSITLRLAGLAIALLAVAALLGYVVKSIRDGGYEAAVEDVATEEKGTLDAVSKARRPLDDCRARGGVWQRETATCHDSGWVRPDPGASATTPGR